MEKSNAERLKEALLYAPVGAFGFLRDNAPTFFSMFVSRGKRDVNKTAAQAEEKISSTKEHGQFVAMGTPIMRTRAEKLTGDAKAKGEDIASYSIDAALGALNFLENAVKSLAESVAGDIAETKQAERSGHIEPSQATPIKKDEKVETPKAASIVDVSPSRGEGEFIAEPANDLLPVNLQSVYAQLSAPEIIDKLDDYGTSDLPGIREFEADHRNRQTIIHAIDFRLNKTS